MPRAALLGLLITILLGAPATASAASIAITTGADPTESITTQLGVTGSADATENYADLTVKPSGATGCAANFAADIGTTVLDRDADQIGPYTFASNWTFESAGSYLLCAWLRDDTQPGFPVVATASTTIVVRIPKLTLAIAAPASATSQAVFQASLTGQAETERETFLGAVPDAGRGCAANWSAFESVAGSMSIIDEADITGGPTTVTKNVQINGSGRYLLCAYFQKSGGDTTPEAVASGAIVINAPCVVPALPSRTTLAAMKSALAAAHCPVGRVTYHASVSVPRGSVASLSPRPGTTLPALTPVNIIVSSGAPCVVPSVIGKTLRSARAAIVKAHCTVGHVTQRRSRSYARGRVVGTSKPRHAHLSPRATVGIVVSSGRARR